MPLNNTPPINATGEYSLSAPFSTPSGAIYRCEAIQGFEALDQKNVDIFATYYEPHGLTSQDYENDRTNAINIITLISDVEPTIYVPSSYIAGFPTTTNIPYSRLVMSIDLGVLPDGLDLTSVMSVIQSQCSEVIGQTATVDLHKVSIENSISESQHEQLEANRLAAIVERETPYAALQRLTNEIAALNTRIGEMATIILNQRDEIEALTPP